MLNIYNKYCNYRDTGVYLYITVFLEVYGKMTDSIVQQSTQLGRAILKANEKFGNKIGSLIIHACGNAKILTYTYPKRVITCQMPSNFTFNELKENATYDFQHLTPASHKLNTTEE